MRALRNASLLAVSLVLLTAAVSPAIYAANDSYGVSYCPDGMPADDCAAIYGNWAKWAPNSNTSASDCSGSSAPLSGGNHVEQAFNFFMSKPGMTAQAAAGIVGNFQAESYDNLDPTAGDLSNGPYGLAQWLGGRLDNLKKYAGSKVSDFSTQLNFSWKELSTDYRSTTLLPIEKAKTAKDAAFIVYTYYEGPNDGSYPAREANATKVFNDYAGNTDPTDTSGTDTTTTTDTGDCSGVTDGSCSVNAPVTEEEYSQAQLTQIFGNPGTASSHPDLHLTTVSFLGHKVSVSPKVAPCLSAVSQQLSSENVNYTIRMMGCYRFDSNNGTTNIGLQSYHTYGAACDINWDTNPIITTPGGTAPHDMPQAYIQAFHDHGFTWGGDWHSKKDYMHFEFHGIQP